jgi:hypothetical protein
MSYASKVLYTGDGVTTDFTVTMPYLSASHINVFVNETLQLSPMHYSFSGASTIKFVSAPADGDAIVIKRNTSPAATLVDFSDGSTLRADDLDTAYLHNYYLSQEYADSWNDLINQAFVNVATGVGIVETETDALIAALVAEMLNDSAATELQARITDIDTNAEAIITLGNGLQTQINTLAQGVAANVYVQADEPVPGVGGIPDPIAEGSRWYDSDDNNKPYIYQSLAWVSIEDPRIGDADTYINLLQTEYGASATAFINEVASISNEAGANTSALALIGAVNGTNDAFILDLNTVEASAGESLANRFTSIQAAAEAGAATYTDAEVLSEQIARAAADTAIAADVTTLTSTVGDNTASITTLGASIDGIEAEYGVTLDVNGYVAGFKLINTGTASSAFVIAVDKFAVADASNPSLVPFEIVGGKINMRADVQIDGDLMVSGTINGSALINGTIGTTQIGANAITSTQINANAVTASKILANAVTADKINVANLAAVDTSTGSLTVDGTLTMGTAGVIKNSGGGYATGNGFFLGYSTGYKFSVGDFTSGQYMKWDGTTLTVKGDLFVGEYIASNTLLLSADTARFSAGTDVLKKSFTIDRAGTVRVTFDAYTADVTNQNGNVEIWVDGVLYTTQSLSNTSYSTFSHDISGLSADSSIDLYTTGGRDFENAPTSTFIRNARIKADVTIPADGGTVDLN